MPLSSSSTIGFSLSHLCPSVSICGSIFFEPYRCPILERFGAAVHQGFADSQAAADFDPAFAAEADVEDARAGQPFRGAVAAFVGFGDEDDEALLRVAD